MIPINIRLFLKSLRSDALEPYTDMANQNTASFNANEYMHIKIKRTDRKKENGAN